MFTRNLPLLAAVLIASSLQAGDVSGNPPAATPTVRESLSNIVALGPGVHRIKTDADGRVRSCIVVAQSPITTVLGTARGLHMARSRAELTASAEFVKWLKRSTDIRETSETETIVVLEGTDKEGQASRQETGKRVEKDTAHYTVTAQGLVRGLQVLHVDIDGEDGIYTLVMGWSTEGAAAARQAANYEAHVPTAGPRPRNTDSRPRTDTSIRSRSATAEDAKKFLD